MTVKEDIELVRQGYDAFIAGDMEWMNEHLHENILWHEPGGNFLSGDVRGREALLAHFAKQVQHFLPEFDVHDVVANDEHGVVLVSHRLTRTDGSEHEYDAAHVYHLRDGKLAEAWECPADPLAFDRAWA